jgi:nitrite reductase (NADH) small subunit
MSDWKKVCLLEELPEGGTIETVFDDLIIAIFKVEGKIYAMNGICPHHGGPLAQGKLRGCTVTCPWHGWQFDVTTGAYQSNQTLFQETYAVKIEEGMVLVNLLKKNDNDLSDL